MAERDYNLSFAEIEALPAGREKAIQWLVIALLTDGGHHKQWLAGQALEALGVPLEELRRDLLALPEAYEFEDGIAP